MGVVGILGTVHGEDSFRKELGYTLDVMKQAIVEFKPDIICGEIRPEDWEKYSNDNSYSGYLGPNEYRRMIIPLCEREGIKFEPVDWFEEDMVSMDYFQNFNQIQQEQFTMKLEEMYRMIWETGKKSILPFNSFEFNELIMKKQDWFNSLEPTIHNIYWTARNQLMIERIKKVILDNQDKRILCTVGAEHNYFYYDELKKMNCNLIFPIK